MSAEIKRPLARAAGVLALMAAFLVVVWFDDPTVGGFLTGGILAGFAGLWLPTRIGIAVTAPYAVALFFVQHVGHGHAPGAVMLIVIGAIVCFAIGVFVRSRHDSSAEPAEPEA